MYGSARSSTGAQRSSRPLVDWLVDQPCRGGAKRSPSTDRRRLPPPPPPPRSRSCAASRACRLTSARSLSARSSHSCSSSWRRLRSLSIPSLALLSAFSRRSARSRSAAFSGCDWARKLRCVAASWREAPCWSSWKVQAGSCAMRLAVEVRVRQKGRLRQLRARRARQREAPSAEVDEREEREARTACCGRTPERACRPGCEGTCRSTGRRGSWARPRGKQRRARCTRRCARSRIRRGTPPCSARTAGAGSGRASAGARK